MSGMEDLEETMIEETSMAKPNSRYLSVHDLKTWYQSKCPAYFENPLVADSPSLRGLRINKRLDTSVLTPVRACSSPPRKSRKSLDYDSENECPSSPKRSKHNSGTSKLTEKTKCDLGSETPHEEAVKRSLRSTPKKYSDTDALNILDLTPKKEDASLLRGNNDISSPISRELRSTPQKLLTTPKLSEQISSTPKTRSILKNSSRVHAIRETEHPSPLNSTFPVTSTPTSVLRTPKSVWYGGTPIDNHVTQRNGPGSKSLLGTPKLSRSCSKDIQFRRKCHIQMIVIILENADYFPNNVVAQLLKVLR
jgi:hypothetical protein